MPPTGVCFAGCTDHRSISVARNARGVIRLSRRPIGELLGSTTFRDWLQRSRGRRLGGEAGIPLSPLGRSSRHLRSHSCGAARSIRVCSWSSPRRPSWSNRTPVVLSARSPALFGVPERSTSPTVRGRASRAQRLWVRRALRQHLPAGHVQQPLRRHVHRRRSGPWHVEPG